MTTDARGGVLIVEDEALVALYTAELLEEAGYTVVGMAATGASALATAAQDPPALALVDVRLPGGMDGIEVAGELRRRFGTRIVFISGTLDAATLARAQPLDPYACLQKPVRPAELLAVVAEAIKGAPTGADTTGAA
ncbi:response regulator [Azospirillum sp. ST 5-10]|uniref:response regulator n=1 Tax=unclassified Azospirillum TaxID=2630922 RepID=UPI003F4A58BD